MPAYHTFTTSRATAPDPVVLLTNVRTAAESPTASVGYLDHHTVTVKKPEDWTTGQISAVQTAIDTTIDLTPQASAQYEVDRMPIWVKALVLALVDEINTLRANLPTPLPPRTPVQALNAIRNKAATL